MLIISCGVITLLMAAPKPRQAFNLLRRSKQNGVLFVGVIIFILWAQTGFTAVETRFGIIPWCGLAVAAAYGAITWVNEFKLGVHRWVPAGFGLVMAGSGLWISRWLLSTVDPVQRAIAAGCWVRPQLSSEILLAETAFCAKSNYSIVNWVITQLFWFNNSKYINLISTTIDIVIILAALTVAVNSENLQGVLSAIPVW